MCTYLLARVTKQVEAKLRNCGKAEAAVSVVIKGGHPTPSFVGIQTVGHPPTTANKKLPRSSLDLRPPFLLDRDFGPFDLFIVKEFVDIS